MRRAPPRPMRKCFVRNCCTVVQEHELRTTTLQSNAKRHFVPQRSHFTLHSHSTLHSSLFTLRASHFTFCTWHFTLHTSSHLISFHLISSHLSSSHLISPHLSSSHFISSRMSSKFFSTIFISSERCSKFSSHRSSSALLYVSKLLLSERNSSTHKAVARRTLWMVPVQQNCTGNPPAG